MCQKHHNFFGGRYFERDKKSKRFFKHILHDSIMHNIYLIHKIFSLKKKSKTKYI
jgi:hypothetical protein